LEAAAVAEAFLAEIGLVWPKTGSDKSRSITAKMGFFMAEIIVVAVKLPADD
jgi:hypothetical protein